MTGIDHHKPVATRQVLRLWWLQTRQQRNANTVRRKTAGQSYPKIRESWSALWQREEGWEQYSNSWKCQWRIHPCDSGVYEKGKKSQKKAFAGVPPPRDRTAQKMSFAWRGHLHLPSLCVMLQFKAPTSSIHANKCFSFICRQMSDVE